MHQQKQVKVYLLIFWFPAINVETVAFICLSVSAKYLSKHWTGFIEAPKPDEEASEGQFGFIITAHVGTDDNKD